MFRIVEFTSARAAALPIPLDAPMRNAVFLWAYAVVMTFRVYPPRDFRGMLWLRIAAQDRPWPEHAFAQRRLKYAPPMR